MNINEKEKKIIDLLENNTLKNNEITSLNNKIELFKEDFKKLS